MNTIHYNPQRRLPLLPGYFKWIGWAMIIMIAIIILVDNNNGKEFGPIRASWINHPIIFLFSIVGLIFIAYAAMRDEDEYTGLCRFRANRIALLVVLRNFLVTTSLMEAIGYPRQSWFVVDYVIVYLGVYYAALLVQRSIGGRGADHHGVQNQGSLKTFSVDKFLKKYKTIRGMKGSYRMIDSIPPGAHHFKDELLKRIKERIKNEDDDDLDLYLAMAGKDGMDEDYKPILKQLLRATWHEQQEDIVEYMRDIKDDDFTDDLYEIAIDPSRWPYRDEVEPILRKVVHGLKEINSERSNAKIELLKKTGNVNVGYVLEIYK